MKIIFPGGSVNKKKIPEIQEMQQELCQGDPLEKELATHSSILAWESHGQEPGGLQPTGSQGVGHD